MSWAELSVSIPYPTSGFVAFWLICGSIHAAIMAAIKIASDIHADWLAVHGIEAIKGRLSLWHIAIALALGPVGLCLGLHMLFVIQPRSFVRDSPEAIWKRIEEDT